VEWTHANDKDNKDLAIKEFPTNGMIEIMLIIKLFNKRRRMGKIKFPNLLYIY